MARGQLGGLFGLFLGLAAFLNGGTAGAEDYMLGLKCRPASRVDAAGNEVRGLLVQDVLEGGPADRAGIRRGQLLVQAGQRRLRGLDPLREAVRQCEGRPMELTVLTEGKDETTVVVKPAPRADGQMLTRDVEQLGRDAQQLGRDGGIGGLLQNLGAAADLLNLGDVDIDIRRGPARGDADALRQLQDSRDAIAIYGRINVGQLLGSLLPKRSPDPEDDQLREEVRRLRREVDALKKQLQALPESESPSDL